MRDEARLPVPADVVIARLKSLGDKPPPQEVVEPDEDEGQGDDWFFGRVSSASVPELPSVNAPSGRRVTSPLRLSPLDATNGFQRILRGELPDDDPSENDTNDVDDADDPIVLLRTARATRGERSDDRGVSGQGLAGPDGGQRLSISARAREFTKEHLAVILVIAVVAGVFTASQLLRARSQEVPLAEPTVVTSGSAEPSLPATPELIQVHVLGAVARPGVVSLPVGARVHEAISACGGMSEDADPAELNLAAVLSDGAQVIIGVRGSPQGEVVGSTSGGTTGSSSNTKVNLNTATSAQLETLPGVGPVTAGRIIAWREAHGKFTTTAELQEVSGIGAKTYAQLEPYVCV